MPVRSVILLIMNFANIMCNFYLFKYLEDKRKESTGNGLQKKGTIVTLGGEGDRGRCEICHTFFFEDFPKYISSMYTCVSPVQYQMLLNS